MNIFFDSSTSNFSKDCLDGICKKIPSIKKIITIKNKSEESFQLQGNEILSINLEDTITSNYFDLDKIPPIDKDVFNSLNLDS